MSSLTIEVAEDLKQQIEEGAERQGLDVSEFVLPALQQLVTGSPDARSTTDQPLKPIWQVIIESVQDLPPEELERLPTDLSAEHDHYIYGTPKRSG
jgi:hypothetical protein